LLLKMSENLPQIRKKKKFIIWLNIVIYEKVVQYILILPS
jgi:hypothetical protein